MLNRVTCGVSIRCCGGVIRLETAGKVQEGCDVDSTPGWVAGSESIEQVMADTTLNHREDEKQLMKTLTALVTVFALFPPGVVLEFLPPRVL